MRRARERHDPLFAEPSSAADVEGEMVEARRPTAPNITAVDNSAHHCAAHQRG